MINIFQPQLGLEELTGAGLVFASNWLGKGKMVDQFEAAFANYIDVGPEHCLAITSCTEGLFQAIELLDIGLGDEVVIPTVHFIGAANAVMSRGAIPVFCDVNRYSLNATVDNVMAKLTGHTRAVISLHYGSDPGDIAAIAELCRGLNIALIEDCACSVASSVNGQACGTFGDIGVWSFDPMKVITTGDGGMMYIKRPDLLDRARKQIYLGIDSASGLSSHKERWWEFGADYPGRRCQMNDITAAIGVEQLKKLGGFVTRRRQIAGYYRDRLADFLPAKSSDHLPYYFFWLQLPERDELASHLKQNRIYTTFRYYPLHWALRTGDNLPDAEWAAEHTLLLPLHSALTDGDINHIVELIKGSFN